MSLSPDPATDRTRSPIAVMSFNRPGYLEQTLQSLKAQSGDSLKGHEVHLFQDGAVNVYSRLRHADDADITACMAVFQSYFPDGEVHFWGDNIGICESFDRAEQYLFEERGFEFAYFFEDDLVLSPAYLEMMERLEEFARSSPRVAYFSAYGDHYAGPEEVVRRHREVGNLDHHWAFGLRRTAWTEIRAFLAPYYEIVCGEDYARRDHRAIFKLFAAYDAVPRGSSQDTAKAWACDRLGLWRCRTFVPFARYIGQQGAHMTPALYDAIGFRATLVADHVVDDLIFPDEAGIDAGLSAQRALFQAIMRDEFDAIIAALPARKCNPMRRCTAEDVRMAYRLLLHREPESDAIIDGHLGKTAVVSLIRGLLTSTEFDGLAKRVELPR